MKNGAISGRWRTRALRSSKRKFRGDASTKDPRQFLTKFFVTRTARWDASTRIFSFLRMNSIISKFDPFSTHFANNLTTMAASASSARNSATKLWPFESAAPPPLSMQISCKSADPSNCRRLRLGKIRRKICGRRQRRTTPLDGRPLRWHCGRRIGARGGGNSFRVEWNERSGRYWRIPHPPLKRWRWRPLMTFLPFRRHSPSHFQWIRSNWTTFDSNFIHFNSILLKFIFKN